MIMTSMTQDVDGEKQASQSSPKFAAPVLATARPTSEYV